MGAGERRSGWVGLALVGLGLLPAVFLLVLAGMGWAVMAAIAAGVMVPGVWFCLMGLKRGRGCGAAVVGLVLAGGVAGVAGWTAGLTIGFGSGANRFNNYRFERFCGKSAFWLGYPVGKLEGVKVERSLFEYANGALLFESGGRGYEIKDVIAFAEENGWAYRGDAEVARADILGYLAGRKGEGIERTRLRQGVYGPLVCLLAYRVGEEWLGDGFTALAFDTGHVAGAPSYAFVENGGGRMVVQANANMLAMDESERVMLDPMFYDEAYAEVVEYYPPAEEERNERLGLVGVEGSRLVVVGSGEEFRVWGVNYDRDEGGRLIEEYWGGEWERVVEDFGEMSELGANVVRVHLQVGAFMEEGGGVKEGALERVGRLVDLAEREGLYLIVTGLGCYDGGPGWYAELSEEERWAVQERFWEAVAGACGGSDAVLAYDLMNEPILPGEERAEGWLAGEFGGKHFVQRLALELKGRSRDELARAWVERMVGAVRRGDGRHLVTLGVIPWTMVWPGARPVFYREGVGEGLDFVSVHVYPESGKVAAAVAALDVFVATGRPVVVGEMFPLKCSVEELEEFVAGTRGKVAGYVGFYWGAGEEEYLAAGDMAGALKAGWLRWFRSK